MTRILPQANLVAAGGGGFGGRTGRSSQLRNDTAAEANAFRCLPRSGAARQSEESGSEESVRNREELGSTLNN